MQSQRCNSITNPSNATRPIGYYFLVRAMPSIAILEPRSRWICPGVSKCLLWHTSTRRGSATKEPLGFHEVAGQTAKRPSLITEHSNDSNDSHNDAFHTVLAHWHHGARNVSSWVAALLKHSVCKLALAWSRPSANSKASRSRFSR